MTEMMTSQKITNHNYKMWKWGKTSKPTWPNWVLAACFSWSKSFWVKCFYIQKQYRKYHLRQIAIKGVNKGKDVLLFSFCLPFLTWFDSYRSTGDTDGLNGASWLADNWCEIFNLRGQENLTEVDQLDRQTQQKEEDGFRQVQKKGF